MNRIHILHAGYCTAHENFAMQGGARKRIHFPAMFTLFEHPKFGAMLFDTGYSQRFFDETKTFPNRIYRWLTPVTLREEDLAINQLATMHIRAQDISHIFISHFHADHICALADFPSAKYVYLRDAYETLRFSRGPGSARRAFIPNLIPSDFDSRSTPFDRPSAISLPPEYAPFARGFDLLGDESLIAVELPGHALGQMGLFARDADGKIFFFVADAAWLKRSIVENRPPHRIANLLFSDKLAYRETLSRLHKFHAMHPSIQIIPSHCEETIRLFAAKPKQ